MNQKGKILVVDDDRLVLATITHGLSQAGYEVIDADNGDDAILLAREHKPELALLDIRMEGKSGFDVAAYLRDYCQIPFMFLSAFTDDATAKQVKELGAITYLVKPLDINQIVPAVEAAFAMRRQALTSSDTASVAEPAPETALEPAPASTDASSLCAESAEPAELPDDPLVQTVALAVGIVMHRHSLDRQQALQRMRKQAAQENRPLTAWCERLLDAQEVLTGMGPLLT